jgi:hypothetical protein
MNSVLNVTPNIYTPIKLYVDYVVMYCLIVHNAILNIDVPNVLIINILVMVGYAIYVLNDWMDA